MRACVACVSVVELGDIVTSCILDEKILLELRSRAVSSYCMHTTTTVLAAASLPPCNEYGFLYSNMPVDETGAPKSDIMKTD